MDIREKAGRAVAAHFAPDVGHEEMIETTWRSHRRQVDVALLAVSEDVEAMIRAGDVAGWHALLAEAAAEQERQREGAKRDLADVRAGLYDGSPPTFGELAISLDGPAGDDLGVAQIEPASGNASD